MAAGYLGRLPLEREELSLNKYRFFFHQARSLFPSFSQLVNLVKIVLSYLFSALSGHSFVWGYPVVLMVEPSNRCNLCCPLCLFASDREVLPRGEISLENFKKVLDQMRGQTKFLLLWNRGEPFMNRELVGMIREAKKRGIFVQTSTNGHFLSSQAEAVVKSGLDELIVSVDGIDQQTYLRYRKGGRLDQVFAGVEAVVRAKRRERSTTPFITLQFLVMKHNEHQIEGLREIARKLGADRVLLKTVRVSSPAEAEEFLPSRSDFSRYTVNVSADGEKRLQVRLTRRSCRRLWYSTVVNWDGEVSPCCFDEKGEHSMGNIFTRGFAKIWKGDKYQRFRTQLLENRMGIPMCRNCTEGIEKLYVSEIWVS